jgi:exodeoxyribonuclease VII large subunit
MGAKRQNQGDLFASPAVPTDAQPKRAADGTAMAVERKATPRIPSEVWSVSELTQSIKALVEPTFSTVRVRGEVSGFRGANARGHLYFSLKDVNAVVDVKVWQTLARTLLFPLKDGLSLVVEGALSIYEPQGRYSLIVRHIEPDGVGARALAFEALKARLLQQGLIGPNKRRRALPAVPKRIGVVTSLSGAALKDFVQVLHRRNPNVVVLAVDARVQGDGAVADIVRGLNWMNRQAVDLVVLTRGGGSVDDLWVFNDEKVARAIAACVHPIVSAVGHEIDVTLSDLVADVRAATPSVAAELCTPVRDELLAALSAVRHRLARAMRQQLERSRHALQLKFRTVKDPRLSLVSKRLTLSALFDRLVEGEQRQRRLRREHLDEWSARLANTHPRQALAVNRAQLQKLSGALQTAHRQVLQVQCERLRLGAQRLERQSPQPRIVLGQRHLQHLQQTQLRALKNLLGTERERLKGLGAVLSGLSPLNVLARGYAIVSRAVSGEVVERASQVQPGEALRLRFATEPQVLVTVSDEKNITPASGEKQ